MSATEANGLNAQVTRRATDLVWPAIVALVVIGSLSERFGGRARGGSYSLLIPDPYFIIAISLLFAKGAWSNRNWSNRNKRAGGLRDTRPVLVQGLFVAILVVMSYGALLFAPSGLTSAGQITKTVLHLVALSLCALIIGTMLTMRLVAVALWAYVVVAASVSILAIVQVLDQNWLHWGISSALHLTFRFTDGFTRPSVYFSEPAYLGYTAVTGFLLSCRLAVAGLHRRVVTPVAAICLVAALLAAAAGPLVVGVVCAVFLLARFGLHSAPPGRSARLTGALVVVALVGLIVSPLGGTLRNRAVAMWGGHDVSSQIRSSLNRASLEVWKDAPVTGIGLGDSRLIFPKIVHAPYAPPGGYMFNSGNVYLTLLAETGPVGLAAFLVFLAWLLAPKRTVSGWIDDSTLIGILLFTGAFLFIGGLLLPMFWLWVGLRLAIQTHAPLIAGQGHWTLLQGAAARA
jgi:hypothetical protein